jgi:hypothetical protein
VDRRKQIYLRFFAIVFAGTALLTTATFLVRTSPAVRWAPALIFLGTIVAGATYLQRARKSAPPPRAGELDRAAKATQRLGIIFLFGFVVGGSLNFRGLIQIGHGFGAVILLFPLGLGLYYIRVSRRLRKRSRETPVSE